MKSKISVFALSIATACMMASCLGDNDDYNYTYYDDTAITEFTLGKLQIIMPGKKKDGSDSISTFSGNAYKIFIDHYAATITNAPDSLPVNTDLKHVLISSVTCLNNGFAGIQNLTDTFFVEIRNTDSLDFTKPRVVRVMSQNRANHRDYTVNIVAHKENADDFKWNKLNADADISNYTSVKAGVCNGKLLVLGKTSEGSELKVLADGNWTKINNYSAEATMATDGKAVYISDGNTVYTTSDATNWQTMSSDVKSVIGVCGNELFAVSNDNKLMMSLDNGATWKEDALDDDAKFLPSSDINFIATKTASNDDVYRAIIVGNSSASSNKAVVWSKIIEDNADKDQKWIYQEFNKTNNYYLPVMKNLSVVPYNNGMIAIGDNNDCIYYSIDCGITWKNDARFALPEGFSANAASIAVDANNFVWIVCTGTGQVWKGRLNKLGWAK